jgi:hypothetical protein
MNVLIGMTLLLIFTWIVSRRDPQSEADDIGLRPLKAEQDPHR